MVVIYFTNLVEIELAYIISTSDKISTLLSMADLRICTVSIGGDRKRSTYYPEVCILPQVWVAEFT
jgi:hypothetical protein